jgi:hypothetical protein
VVLHTLEDSRTDNIKCILATSNQPGVVSQLVELWKHAALLLNTARFGTRLTHMQTSVSKLLSPTLNIKVIINLSILKGTLHIAIHDPSHVPFTVIRNQTRPTQSPPTERWWPPRTGSTVANHVPQHHVVRNRTDRPRPLIITYNSTIKNSIERQIRVVSTAASYLRGPRFKSPIRDRISWLRFSVVLRVPPDKCRDSTTTASVHILSNSSFTLYSERRTSYGPVHVCLSVCHVFTTRMARCHCWNMLQQWEPITLLERNCNNKDRSHCWNTLLQQRAPRSF